MMRYERKIAILGGSLALLLAIYAAGIVFSPERSAARSQSRKLLAGKAEEAATIELGSPKLSLVKEGDAWYLAEAGAKLPAKQERVKSFLETLAAVNRLRPVARSKDAWKSFELDEGGAKPVMVRDGKGKALADFSLGGYGQTGDEVFLRLAGSDASYAAESSFSSYVTAGRKSWLDLRVMPALPEGDVEAISVRSALSLDGAGKPILNLDYTLRRQKEGWSGIAGSIDQQLVSNLLRSALNLEGEDLAASVAPKAFEPPAAKVELSLGAGGSKTLEIGTQAGEGQFYLRLAGSKQVYLVSAYGLRNILKQPADLLAKKQ